jgi:hypothetical protein
MDMSNLKKEFASPANTYRFAPFWFLNHDLEDKELAWQINEMNDNGVGGFILHARHGLITPYLSDEWMDRMKTCIEEADKLKMKAILYDENNWPSGPVDGELIEKHPEYRMSGCIISGEWTVSGGKRVKEKIDPMDGLIAVVAVPVSKKGVLEGLPQSAVSLKSSLKDGVLDWTAPEGRWQVMAFARKFLVPFGFFGGYLDTLSKDAVAEFIKMTHEKYAERFAEYFGGAVDAIFTDEPSMNYHPRDRVQWTPTLPSEFTWRHDYDIEGVLPALFKDAGPATAQLRCDFYDTITELYSDAFFKQIYDWCDVRRLKSIGHVLGEGELYQETRHQGDIFRGAKYLHYGGCDFLFARTWPECGNLHEENNLLGPKLASSAAHIYGKPRVMSEAFGVAAGWQIDLRTLKWMTDWQVMLGVNLFEPHAFYYSIQGHRKWECPPGEFYQSTFWPYYKTFADYTSRLCSVLSGTFHVADVALVFPSRAMWAAINPDRTPEADRIINAFERVSSALLRAGFDFDILPEETLVRDMDPTELEHHSSLERYQAIVVPGCPTILSETAHFLNMAIQDGSAVVVCDDFPKSFVEESGCLWSDEYLTPDVLADQFRLEYNWNNGQLEQRPSGAEDETRSAIIPDVGYKDVFDLAQAISATLTGLIDPDVIVNSVGDDRPYVPDIVHCHYRRGDTDFVFLANTSLTESYRTTISVNALGMPAIWDAATGEVTPIEDYDFQGELLAFSLEFAPTQSYLISISPGDVSTQPAPAAKQDEEKVTALGQEWEFSTLTPNALPIADWRFKMGAGDNTWTPGFHDYVSEFECETELKAARLLIDGLLTEKIWRRSEPINVKILLNDEPVTGFEDGRYIDHLIREADVTGMVKKGKNVLRIHTTTQLAPAGNLSVPAYLIGDFALEGRPDEWKITKEPGKVKTGSWADQGYPYFSGTASYKQKVKLGAMKGRVLLRMEKPADMAEIIINGKQAAVLPWEPWEADITQFVISGENEVEIRVTNSMANVLNMTPKESGILGKVEIVELA